MDLGLTGRRALITGASRGIGRSVAHGLVAEGCNVAICGRDAATVAGRVEALQASAPDVIVWGAAVDVIDHTALRRWALEAAERLGGVDIVVSNVSALGGAPDTVEKWRTIFETDVLGSVELIDAVMPFLEASGIGSIVQLGTITAIEYHAYPDGSRAYGALKAALINWVNQLAIELAPKHIRANVVSPGPIHIDDGSWGRILGRNPDYYEANREHHPAGRLGTPEEVADVITFLCSPRAGWVTGENIVVDGGFTRRVAF